MRSLPWFRVDVDLMQHPKISALCEELQTDCAGWYLIQLWAWTVRYSVRGRFADRARTAIESSCGWRGDKGRLIEAFVSVGLVDRIESDANGNTFEVHDWWDQQGAAIQKAEKDRERKRLERLSKTRDTKTPTRAAVERPRTVHGQSTDSLRSGAGDGTRRDETTKETYKEMSADVAALREAWNETAGAAGAVCWTETSPARELAAAKALKRRSLEQWRRVFVAIASDSFATGMDPGNNWRADVDYALRPGGKKPEPALRYLERLASNTQHASHGLRNL